MKKQSRILTKGSKTAAASQAKSEIKPAITELQKQVEISLNSTGEARKAASKRVQEICRQELAKLRPAGTVTCVWTCPDGTEWARVKFEGELFAIIESAASKLGITLKDFFDNAIRDYCDSQD